MTCVQTLRRPDLLECTFNRDALNAEVEKALADYSWKGDLKDEGTVRLSMWEASHLGEEYALGAVQEYKNLVDNAVRREVAFRDSGEVYRAALQGTNCWSLDYIAEEVARIEHNIEISTSDQGIEIAHYQTVELDFQYQEQQRQRAKFSAAIEEQKRIIDEVQEKAMQELLRKQEEDRLMWEQRARIATGAGLGTIGIGLLALTMYQLGKGKK